MKALKIISLVLVCAMCLTMFAACAGDDQGTVVTKDPNSSSAQESGNFASADYGGDEFTFLYIKHTDIGKDYYGGDYLDAESYNGGTINDSVYKRNIAVEEKYNVNVDQKVEINGDPASVLQTYYMSGDFCFDAIYGWGYKLGACITQNYFADFNALQNADLTQEYWSPTAMDDLTIDGKLYLCINDISMNKLEWAGFLFFNKQIAEDYNIESQFGSPYDLVNNGTWTLDTFLAMVSSISTDLNGDGSITKDDVYGLIDGGGDGSFASHTSGIFNTAKADDGSYSLNFYNEKLLGIISKVNPVLSNSKYVKDYDEIWEGADWSGFTDKWEYARNFFVTDHALFSTGSAYITSEFRNMEHEYGILPMPKYDSNQENYYSMIDCLSSIFAIPSTTRNDVESASNERTGTILEYMAYKSNEILLPAYYDEMLSGQRLQTEEDRAMLDTIRNSVHYEFTEMIGLTDISDVLKAMFEKPSTATSTYNRQSKKLNNELSSFYTDVLLLGTQNADSSAN